MMIWWMGGLSLIAGCGAQEDAISQMVQVHIQTPVAVVAQAEQRDMVDFMIAPRMLPHSMTTARWEQCLYEGEDVRRHFPPRLAMVEVAPDMIRISGHPVMALDAYSVAKDDVRGQLLLPLYDSASSMADDAKRAGSYRGCWPDFEGRVLIAHHPDMPFSILRKVMFTLGQAQFSEFFWMVSVGDVDAGQAATLPPVNAYSVVTVLPSTLPAIGPAGSL